MTSGAGAQPPSLPVGISRRRLLEGGAALTGLIVAHGAGARAPGGGARESARAAAARLEAELPEPTHATNGDETALPGWIACYSKGLPHNAEGEVDPAAYRLLLRAVASRDPADFESIPLGGFVKLANPQAALAENLIGPDPGRLDLVPPPRFASAEQASELIELYWQALLRDVAFEDYETHPLAQRAAAELTRLAEFKGPRAAGGTVTPRTLFRGPGADSATGPYLSQFLYRDVFLPPVWVKQQERTAAAGIDFMTRHDTWLDCQNGALTGVNRFDPMPMGSLRTAMPQVRVPPGARGACRRQAENPSVFPTIQGLRGDLPWGGRSAGPFRFAGDRGAAGAVAGSPGRGG